MAVDVKPLRGGKHLLQVPLDAEMQEALRRAAEADDRTKTQQARYILRQGLREFLPTAEIPENRVA